MVLSVSVRGCVKQATTEKEDVETVSIDWRA